MPKDDPLSQARRPATTLWLNSGNMEQARENFWRAYLELRKQQPQVVWREWSSTEPGNVTVTSHIMTEDEAHAIFHIAWAAAIAAFSFVMEGRVEPKR